MSFRSARVAQFLNDGGLLAAIVGGWQLAGNYDYQPGSLLDWSNLFFYGDLDDIAVDNPTLDRWFNIDAGFEKDPARTPAAFQKRQFPFRIDGVRGQALSFLNMSVTRSLGIGSRTGPCSCASMRRTSSTGSTGRTRTRIRRARISER